jgi:hypothetical protein
VIGRRYSIRVIPCRPRRLQTVGAEPFAPGSASVSVTAAPKWRGHGSNLRADMVGDFAGPSAPGRISAENDLRDLDQDHRGVVGLDPTYRYCLRSR